MQRKITFYQSQITEEYNLHNTRIVQKEVKVVLFIDRREKLPLLSLSFIPAFFSTITLRFVASRRVISCHLHTRYTWW